MKLVCSWCSLEVNLVLNKDYVWVNLEGGLFRSVLEMIRVVVDVVIVVEILTS